MDPLSWPDDLHLAAAQGWLELGNPAEAALELARLSAENLEHPDALQTQWQIHAACKDWEACISAARHLTEVAPEWDAGWINLSFALHELHRTREAWDNLQGIANRFPQNPTMIYNMACYACQMGDRDEAKKLLEQACALTDDPSKLQLQAKADPDLQPLWAESDS